MIGSACRVRFDDPKVDPCADLSDFAYTARPGSSSSLQVDMRNCVLTLRGHGRFVCTIALGNYLRTRIILQQGNKWKPLRGCQAHRTRAKHFVIETIKTIRFTTRLPSLITLLRLLCKVTLDAYKKLKSTERARGRAIM